MKKRLFPETLLQVTAPWVTGLALTIAPAQAATFGLSEAEVSFTDFNRTVVPDSTSSFTDTDTSTSAAIGTVTAESQANAIFLSTPPLAVTQTFSTVFGDGLDYIGTASSQAQVIGSFFIPGMRNDSLFSFNFEANLNLQAAVDQPITESAIANGTIAFILFGGQDPNQLAPLDFFVLTGNVNTAGADDALQSKQSKHVKLTSKSLDTTFGGSQEAAVALIQGLYTRSFDRPTYLTLVETTTNSVTAASVPEPSSMLAIVISGITGCVLKRRFKTTTNN